MAVTFIGVTTLNDQNNSGSASQNIAVPVGVASGDLLVLVEMSNETGITRAGWTAAVTETALGGGANYVRSFYRLATAGDVGATLSLGTMTRPVVGLYAYRGATALVAAVNGPQAITSTGSGGTVAGATVTVPATSGALLLTAYFSHSSTSGGATNRVWATPGGTARRAAIEGNNSVQHLGVDKAVSNGTAAAVNASIDDIGSTNEVSSGASIALAVYPPNAAPNTPLLVSPVGAVVLDSTSGQRLDWDFSDPDSGDTQSKYDLRYRVVGAASWTDLTGTTSVTHRDVAAGFFADGDYEWQVRTYDAVGLVGPYSASSFFTVATPPPGPSITEPVNGATIAAETYTVVWSSPDQDAYQLRVVADDGAGAPDETTIRYDTGTVTSTSARSASVPFSTNNITEHIQLRVQVDGLWSAPYTTVWVDVSYTAPAAPTLTVFSDSAAGSLAVVSSNPAPTSGQPTVISHDLYRREALDGDDGIRVATGVAPGGTWTDWTPASGVDYEYRTVAFGDNDTSSSSAWTGAATAAASGDGFSGF